MSFNLNYENLTNKNQKLIKVKLHNKSVSVQKKVQNKKKYQKYKKKKKNGKTKTKN